MCVDGNHNHLKINCKRCGREGIASLRHHGLGWCRACEDHTDILETLTRLLVFLHKLVEEKNEDIF